MAPVPATAEIPAGTAEMVLAATPLDRVVAVAARDFSLEVRSPIEEICTVSAACLAVFVVIGALSSATSLSTMLLVSRPEARPPDWNTGDVVDMENPFRRGNAPRTLLTAGRDGC